jgi:phosphonatase-like hydrolase
MNEPIELVIFDIAGTTIDVGRDIERLLRTTLQGCGVALTDRQIAAVRGASKREAIAELLSAHAPDRLPEIDAVYSRFREGLDAAAREFRPMAGAEAAIGQLRATGRRIAFNTGFDSATTTTILDGVGWRDLADIVVCGDEVPAGRPAPYLIFRAMERARVRSVRRVATVGDTVLDLEAGWNAGVAMNVGVWSGAHSREMLAGAPHTHLIATAADIVGLVG